MPRSSSYNRHKSSRSYSRDRDYKRRSSSDDDYYERKKSHRSSRSPSSSSRSKLSYKFSRRRSDSSSDGDYYRKKRSSKTHKEKKSKKSKRSHRSPSFSSSTSENSNNSSKSKQIKFSSTTTIIESENETKQTFDLKLLEGKTTLEALENIDSDKFEPKAFTSSNSVKQASQKVYIDLNKDTILVPTIKSNPEPINDSLFHPNFLGDEIAKCEKWVKKLFNFRQRLLHNT